MYVSPGKQSHVKARSNFSLCAHHPRIIQRVRTLPVMSTTGVEQIFVVTGMKIDMTHKFSSNTVVNSTVILFAVHIVVSEAERNFVCLTTFFFVDVNGLQEQ